MQFHFTKSPAAPVLPVPAVPALRFSHQRGMYGTCKGITAYCGHEDIGGAHLDASSLTWFIGIQGVERTLKHDLSISLDDNLAAVDAIIADEFAKARAR